ncbi:MAG: mechanosensitive ion channel [Devosia sp.]
MGVAYVAWEAIRVVVDRQIAIERVTVGIGDPEDGAPEGEGGGAGARLGTLLPLERVAVSVAIVVMASLMLLGQFCVSVLPLVAGAGVVGLAIGFGAQTLVKDIISGIFFFNDDAFRLGEYIDVGGVMGTAERISVRSVHCDTTAVL